MSAEVVAYSSHPEDGLLSIKVECRDCGIEFGWSSDTAAANDRLDALVDSHNVEAHGWRRVFL